MENNVKNDVNTLKETGYITEVITPETLNDKISIAKYVTQVGIASKLELNEESTPETPTTGNDETKTEIEEPKNDVIVENPEEVTEDPATKEKDEIVVDDETTE